MAFAVILCVAVISSDKKIVGKLVPNLLDQSFSFGTPSGGYSHDIAVDMQTNIPMLDCEIYYTTDGSMPAKESEKYETPLYYTVGEGLRLVQIKASVYLDGEQIGGPYNATYILTEMPEALKDTLIVSINSEEEGLFGEESGILYPAYSFVKTDSDEDWNHIHAQNFAQKGKDWVRQAHVAVMDDKGKVVLDQDCGLSVSGSHGSIMHYPFSLQLKADSSYQEDKNVFRYDFYKERSMNENGMLYYDSISLKNSGNDYAWGELREDTHGTILKNTLGTRMAKELGLFASDQRIAIVFLNGEFYNIAYLNADLKKKTISVQTGLNDDYIITKKSTEKLCLTDCGLKKIYHSFPDLSDSDIFTRRDEFERKVDVEHLFRYYAFELIVGNTDWTTNNYAMWRYIGNRKQDNLYSDGKYRYWVFDMDCMYQTQEWMTDPWDAIFGETKSENCLLPILMQIDDYKAQFANTVFDELNSETFSEEHMMRLVEEENDRLSPWFTWMYGEDAERERQEDVELLKQRMLARREQVMGYLKQYFGVEDLYTLSIGRGKGLGNVRCNSLELATDSYMGTYDSSYPVKISYEDSAADTIDYWLVNGEKIETEELTIQKSMIKNGMVTVEPVLKRQRKSISFT